MSRYYNDFSDMNDPETLEHYGVKGMQWGKHLFGLAETVGSHVKSTGQTFAAVGKAGASMYREHRLHQARKAGGTLGKYMHTSDGLRRAGAMNRMTNGFKSERASVRRNTAKDIIAGKQMRQKSVAQAGVRRANGLLRKARENDQKVTKSDYNNALKIGRNFERQKNALRDAGETYMTSFGPEKSSKGRLRNLMEEGGEARKYGIDRKYKAEPLSPYLSKALVSDNPHRKSGHDFIQNLAKAKKGSNDVDDYTSSLLKKNGSKLKKQGW